MNNVVCECCYVVHGWIRSCTCAGGPTRTDPENLFGLAEPWIDTSMGRNEASHIDATTKSQRSHIMSAQIPDLKSTLAMTDRELQQAADALARRIASGTTTIGDSMIVIELANRLLRAMPRGTTL